MSDFFDNPLVEFLVQNPKYVSDILRNPKSSSLLHSIQLNFLRRENSDSIPSFYDMIELSQKDQNKIE